ncbi:cytochrome P450 [Micromonospora sp. NPDC093244]|uniref:cytochrome P450 n=1 Tax=Micromonospora sp. NPDC093244 TaxID=3155071 RepID=UPI003433AC97
MTHPDTAIDLADVDMFVRQEHHRAFAYLRQHSPVYWNESPDGLAFWALTRHDDVLMAYRNHASFSSQRGAVLGGSFRSEKDTAAGRMLVASDPPRHRMIRRALHPAFDRDMVLKVERQIRQLVDEALTRLVEDGGGDFAERIVPQLPAGAVMAMMDVDYHTAHELVGLTRQMIGFRDPMYDGGIDSAQLRLAYFQSQIFDFFTDLVRTRRQKPGDDVVSMLLRAELNGRPMREEDILYNCMNVAVGGNETTSYTASSGMIALMENPGEYDRLLKDHGVRDTAIEEFLRWASTNAYVQRVATRDVPIRDTLIRAGDSVTLWNVSANRDEEQFTSPDRFDVTRQPNRHVSYGSGIHRCAGAVTGHTELTVLLDAIIARQLRLEPAGAPQHLRSNFILGVNSLPVAVVGAR